jgi:hypothetical protein
MKKVLFVSMLTLASSFIPVTGGLVPQSYAGAIDQLRDTAGTSGQAADDANSGNYGGAREGSGAGFDGNTYNPTPVVDLSGKQGVVDPNDLKQYDPPKPSLKPSYVPPLP